MRDFEVVAWWLLEQTIQLHTVGWTETIHDANHFNHIKKTQDHNFEHRMKCILAMLKVCCPLAVLLHGTIRSN
jgi:hypothetical protein